MSAEQAIDAVLGMLFALDVFVVVVVVLLLIGPPADEQEDIE